MILYVSQRQGAVKPGTGRRVAQRVQKVLRVSQLQQVQATEILLAIRLRENMLSLCHSARRNNPKIRREICVA
jgi:hypothetical protein